MSNTVIFRPGGTRSEPAVMRDIEAAAVEVGIGLRKSMAEAGIRQITDFVNAMSFGGLMVEKNYPDEKDAVRFEDVFEREIRQSIVKMASEDLEVKRQQMSEHKMGVADQTPTDMLIRGGLATEQTLIEIGKDFDLSKSDVLKMATTIIALSVVSISPPERIDEVVDNLIAGLRERLRAWDEIFPSDDEIWDDEDDDEDV